MATSVARFLTLRSWANPGALKYYSSYQSFESKRNREFLFGIFRLCHTLDLVFFFVFSSRTRGTASRE